MPRDTLVMVEDYTAAALKLAAGIGLTATGNAAVGVPMLLGGVTNATVGILQDTGVLTAKAEKLPTAPTPAPAVHAATPAKETKVLVGFWGESGFATSWVPAGKVESLRAVVAEPLYLKVRKYAAGHTGDDEANELAWVPAGTTPAFQYTLVTERDNRAIPNPPRE